MSTSNVLNLVKCAWFTPMKDDFSEWGVPINLYGESGIGKTQRIRQKADNLGMKMKTILISIHEPQDMAGMPVVDENEDGTRRVSLAPQEWAFAAAESSDPFVLFWDEANGGEASQQNAMLRVVNENTVGHLNMGGHVRHVLAMNPVDISAGGYELAPPLANRMIHIEMGAPDVETWRNYMTFGPQATDESVSWIDVEDQVRKAWPMQYPRTRALVMAFIKHKPQHLHAQPKAGSAQGSKAWPSPRSWEAATRLLATSEILGLNEEEVADLISGTVGPAGIEFLTWLRHQDLPDPEKVLDGEIVWDIPKNRLDIIDAVFLGMASILRTYEGPKAVARQETFLQIALAVARNNPDVVWPAWQQVGPVMGKYVLKAPSQAIEDALNVLMPKMRQFDQAVGS